VNRIMTALLTIVLTLALGAPVWAQATAEISGTVRDQTGAVLPGVEVTARQTDTGVSRNTVSNETGSYVLSNLPVGPYRLEAALPGFRTFVQTGIVLQVNASPVINPTMEVGQVSEQIEVQANAALVETRTSGVGQVIENQRILELPLNGRNVVELISLAGAATPGTNVSGGSRDVFNTTYVSIAGGVSFGVGYVLDGAMHNNPYSNQALSVPFPDALQEFKVETSATGAQQGVHSSGSVNLVTKSGTNDIHGDLFEFVRNGMFNARNAFATRRDTLKRNQFGGTIGGPITKNKLFFFAGYQGTTIRQDPSDVQGFVPTPAMLAGDFTALASPACNSGRAIALRAPFVNSRIDPAQFSKPALAIVAKMPSSSDPCGKIIYGNPSRPNQHMAVGKIDYQRSSNHSIFGRYVIDSLKDPAPYELNHNLLSASVNGSDGLNQAFTTGDTYLFGANVVNSLRLTANRSATVRTAGETFTFTDVGVKMYSYVPKLMKLAVTGGIAQAQSRGPTTSAIFALSDDISWVKGNHQLAFGAMAGRWDTNWYSCFYCGGIATFNGQITGLGYADFLTGNVFTFSQAPLEIHTGYEWYLGPYINDTWKAAPRLTFNAGLRWEPFFPQSWTDGSAYHLDLDAMRKGVRTQQYRNAPPGITFTGDSGYPGRAVMYNQWKNFSPRVGMAWDVNGDGRTSVRAAFGTFYDIIPIGFHQATNIAPPLTPRITINNARFDDPWVTYPGGNPFPTSRGADAPFPFYSTYAVMKFDTKNPTVAQWNLSIQRQIGASWLLSASYLGSNTAHLWTVQSVNPALFLGLGPCTLNGVSYPTCSTTANTDQRRPLILENPAVGQYFAFVNKVDDGGTASYHGLVLSGQRRAAKGVTVSANYTWSHCISDPFQAGLNGGTGGGTYTNPNSRRFDRGNCTTSATDRRHVFNLTSVAETPQFSNKTLRVVGSGWRFSPILRISSGSYLTITTTTDVALSGISNQRVNQVLGDPYGDGTIGKYLNPLAFALPTTGSLSNMGAGSVRGPGTWQFDAAVSRTFRTGESQRVEFRAETFNLTNSFRMNPPTTTFNSNTFGQVTSALDPRIMQFALKYIF
jgi:Carboxypeptidase regulatory-like domain